MFSGLTNQISGWVANKTGGQPGDPNDPNAQQQMDPNMMVDPNQQQQVQNGAEGEVPLEGEQQAGGVSGMAQGFLAKAMAAKDGVKEKACAFQPPNLSNLGGGMMAGISNMMPGRREEEVPTPPEPIPPTDMGGEMVEQQYTE